jgi:hypothetical protein
MSLKSSNGDLDLPSYNDVITSGRSNNNSNMQSSVQNEVHDEVLNLAIRFNSIQGQKLHQLQQNDEKALDLLIPLVKTFLTEYSEATLPTATLILIPAGTISASAIPADDDLRSQTDFGRVVTVTPEKGQDVAVWDGSDMAERLASYLRPGFDELPPRAGKPVSPQPEATSSKKSSFWRKKPTTGTTISPPIDDKTVDLPKVTMVVKAEEVVFRAESELGLYENQSVWGIIIRVKVNTGRQVVKRANLFLQ